MRDRDAEDRDHQKQGCNAQRRSSYRMLPQQGSGGLSDPPGNLLSRRAVPPLGEICSRPDVPARALEPHLQGEFHAFHAAQDRSIKKEEGKALRGQTKVPRQPSRTEQPANRQSGMHEIDQEDRASGKYGWLRIDRTPSGLSNRHQGCRNRQHNCGLLACPTDRRAADQRIPDERQSSAMDSSCSRRTPAIQLVAMTASIALSKQFSGVLSRGKRHC